MKKLGLILIILIQGFNLFSLGLVIRSEFPTEVTVELSNGRIITKKIEPTPTFALAKKPTHAHNPNQLVIDAFFKGLYITFKTISWHGLDGKMYEVKFDPLGKVGGVLGGILDFIPTGTG